MTDSQIKAIPGWFFRSDWSIFRFALEESSRQVGKGDLLELGAYLGKSAVLIGGDVGQGETFTVLDLFGAQADTPANAAENEDQYPSLTRSRFEENYLKVHDALPSVIQAPSSQVLDHVSSGSHRFVHVDASHLYEHVVGDVRASRELSAPQGIVAFDDYRTFHAVGVSAAVWEATRDGLNPVAVTEMKMYATWGDPDPWVDALARWLPWSGLAFEEERIAENAVFRVWRKPGAVIRGLMELQKRRMS
ncbi:class I SAM-dependent methyltransferase [Gordonia amicalis]|nr:class I SAM-dependent methyltransferase [Gordonia amicalis]NKX76657.1 class I SAM-dependent methyltransferase [Gordonia amicalis]